MVNFRCYSEVVKPLLYSSCKRKVNMRKIVLYAGNSEYVVLLWMEWSIVITHQPQTISRKGWIHGGLWDLLMVKDVFRLVRLKILLVLVAIRLFMSLWLHKEKKVDVLWKQSKHILVAERFTSIVGTIITITIYCDIVYENRKIWKQKSFLFSENIHYNLLNKNNLKRFVKNCFIQNPQRLYAQPRKSREDIVWSS